MEGRVVHPHRDRYLLWVCACLFCLQNLSTTTIQGLTECLIHRHASNQGSDFAAQEEWEWDMTMDPPTLPHTALPTIQKELTSESPGMTI